MFAYAIYSPENLKVVTFSDPLSAGLDISHSISKMFILIMCFFIFYDVIFSHSFLSVEEVLINE